MEDTKAGVSVCSVEGCGRLTHSKGLCQNHYRQAQRRARGLKKPGPSQDPTAPYSKHKPSKPRVYEKKTHCPQGHAYDEANTYVDGSGNRHCRTCRRATMAEIRSRMPKVGQGSFNAAKTHCPKGHEYTDDNTQWLKGQTKTGNPKRHCRACARANGYRQSIKKYGGMTE